MYSAFDSFLKVPTWYTCHPHDERRFFSSLQAVVRNPGFNPDELRTYMLEQKGLSLEETENQFIKAIDKLVTKAWAVKDYLRTTGE